MNIYVLVFMLFYQSILQFGFPFFLSSWAIRLYFLLSKEKIRWKKWEPNYLCGTEWQFSSHPDQNTECLLSVYTVESYETLSDKGCLELNTHLCDTPLKWYFTFFCFCYFNPVKPVQVYISFLGYLRSAYLNLLLF